MGTIEKRGAGDYAPPESTMVHGRHFLALLLALILALAPVGASARAGASYGAGRSAPSYLSQGSRGGQTYSSDGGAPIARSITPNSGIYGTPYQAGGYGYGYRHPSPFWGGFLGGLGGAWLFGHLFGGYGYGYGGGGLLGPLLIFALLYFGIRALFRGMNAPIGTARGMAADRAAYGNPRFASGLPLNGTPRPAALAVTDADFQAFGQLLVQIQAAWSAGDLNRMRLLTTPEMLSYFADQLANNQSLGRANRVERVVLQSGDLREGWSEPGADYATCLLRWTAADYTVRLDRDPGDYDFVVDGDPRQLVEAEELWTFRRARGGVWVLSAIQQLI
jgi:hypothetical protein